MRKKKQEIKNEDNKYFIKGLKENTPIEISTGEIIKNNMEIYGKKVISDRAIPDYRDGMKPVHRRILYAMYIGKYISKNSSWKSARIVGDTLGKFHPHGDKSIYDAIVNMVVDWKNNFPLIEGVGDFGNIDGDEAAAMRYSEIAIKPKISELLFNNLDIVDYVPNYDNKEKEPLFLTPSFPFLLLNGSMGIAYGMSTNIPPFNKNELINSIEDIIDQEFYEKPYEEKRLLKYIKGPDFPTGCIVYTENQEQMNDFILNSSGSIYMRGKLDIDENKKEVRIITVPYNVSTSRIYKKLLELYKNYQLYKSKNKNKEKTNNNLQYLSLKEIPFNGTKNSEPNIILNFTDDCDLKVEINKLYKYTNKELDISFNSKFRVLDKNKLPVLLTLPKYLQEFLKFRKDIWVKRVKKEIEKLYKDLEIQKAIYISVLKIDDVMKIIKEASEKNKKEGLEEKEIEFWIINQFINKIGLNKVQAKYITDMKIIKLSSINIDKQSKKIKELEETINDKEDFIIKPKRIYNAIKEEIKCFKDKEDNRRSEVFTNIKRNINEEDLLLNKKYIISYTIDERISKIDIEKFKEQRKGTKGKKLTKKDNEIYKVIESNTLDYLFVITNKGKVYAVKTYMIPNERSFIKNYLNLEQDEKIIDMINISKEETEQNNSIVFVTEKGLIKKTNINKFKSLLNATGNRGIKSITLKENDMVSNVLLVHKNRIKQDILLVSNNNKAIKFNIDSLRDSSRTSMGVIGMRMDDENSKIISSLFVDDKNQEIVVFTNKGGGKKFNIDSIKSSKNRGGKGITIFKEEENNNSKLVNAIITKEDETIVLISKKGIINKISSDSINEKNRTAVKANKVMVIDDGDELVSVFSYKNIKDEKEEEKI